MKGLLLKDFMLILRSAKILLLLIIIFGIIAVIGNNIAYFAAMLALLCVSCINSIFNYDRAADWNSFALATPISRRQFVLSKYLLVLIAVSFSAALGFVAFFISKLFLNEISAAEFGLICITSLGGALLFLSLLIPLMLHFGTEKGRYIVVLCIALMYFVIFVAAQSITENPISLLILPLPAKTLLMLLPFLLLLILRMSYRVSCAIVKKKEF